MLHYAWQKPLTVFGERRELDMANQGEGPIDWHAQLRPEEERGEAGQEQSAGGAQFLTTASDETGIIDELFRFCTSNIPSCDFAVYFRRAGSRFIAFRSIGIDAALLSGVSIEEGTGFIGTVGSSRGAQLRVDLERDTAKDEALQGFYEKTGARSALAAPLATDGSSMAVLAVYSTQPGVFDLDSMRVLERATVIAAPHVANLRARIETERRLREAELVLDLCGKLDGEESLRELISHVVATAKQITGGETVSVMLMDPETNELWVARADSITAEPLDQSRIPSGQGISGWVAQHSKPLIVRDFPLNGTNGRVKWAVSVPMSAKDRVIGVLNVGSHNRDKDVADEEMRLLVRLASQAAPLIENARRLGEMRQLQMQTMRTLVSAVETQDRYARGHAQSVARYAVAIANELGRPEKEITTIETAGLLHDIGKLSLGEGLLTTKRPLTTVEQSAIQLHPTIAVDIIREAPLLADVVPTIEHHHERFDGTGYGAKLKGHDIPLGARILALADAFDAMTREKPYRGRMTVQEAMGELVRESGGQFDPQLVEVFMKIVKENPEITTPAEPTA